MAELQTAPGNTDILIQGDSLDDPHIKANKGESSDDYAFINAVSDFNAIQQGNTQNGVETGEVVSLNVSATDANIDSGNETAGNETAGLDTTNLGTDGNLKNTAMEMNAQSGNQAYVAAISGETLTDESNIQNQEASDDAIAGTNNPAGHDNNEANRNDQRKLSKEDQEVKDDLNEAVRNASGDEVKDIDDLKRRRRQASKENNKEEEEKIASWEAAVNNRLDELRDSGKTDKTSWEEFVIPIDTGIVDNLRMPEELQADATLAHLENVGNESALNQQFTLMTARYDKSMNSIDQISVASENKFQSSSNAKESNTGSSSIISPGIGSALASSRK